MCVSRLLHTKIQEPSLSCVPRVLNARQRYDITLRGWCSWLRMKRHKVSEFHVIWECMVVHVTDEGDNGRTQS